MVDRPERVYGSRARVALVVPSPNTVAETEFWRLAPPDVSVHTSRMPFFADRHDDPLEEMERHLGRVLEEALSAEPDVIAYGCTASSAKGDPRRYEADLTARTGRPAVTAAGALVAALGALGARRIALLTPYPPAINAKERAFFAANGVEVVVDESIIVDDAQHRLKNMYRVPTPLLVERAVALGRREAVEAIVLSCSDMPTLGALATIEAETGKPVVSSAQALFWRALRAAGIAEPVPGHGRLLELAEHAGPAPPA